LTDIRSLCYICPMPEDKGSLNLRAIPVSVIRRAKASAALEGKTLRIWVIEAIQEKIRKAK
jgi:predicted HicB family RNase H-like nuclease